RGSRDGVGTLPSGSPSLSSAAVEQPRLGSLGPGGDTQPLPAARPKQGSDIKLLLGAGIAVLLGGVVIAAAILAITARGTGPNIKRTVPFGREVGIHDML